MNTYHSKFKTKPGDVKTSSIYFELKNDYKFKVVDPVTILKYYKNFGKRIDFKLI